MNDQLYSAVLRGPPVEGCDLPMIATIINAALGSHLIKTAMKWLEDNQRTHDFLMAYNNSTADKCEVVVKLRDRDTALMLKLALQ
ncbi:hypothetical protein MOP88_07355 [Sphingomonas sp. WKB10]|nr:hypothetical protein [Sphingomonas sp. WKB10]